MVFPLPSGIRAINDSTRSILVGARCEGVLAGGLNRLGLLTLTALRFYALGSITRRSHDGDGDDP